MTVPYCGKRSYPSRYAARKATYHISRKDKHAKILDVYFCDIHNAWHLSSTVFRRRKP